MLKKSEKTKNAVRQSSDKQVELKECNFAKPCSRYMGLLAENDRLVREIERIQRERDQAISDFVATAAKQGWRRIDKVDAEGNQR